MAEAGGETLLEKLLKRASAEQREMALEYARQLELDEDDPQIALPVALGMMENLTDRLPSRLDELRERMTAQIQQTMNEEMAAFRSTSQQHQQQILANVRQASAEQVSRQAEQARQETYERIRTWMGRSISEIREEAHNFGEQQYQERIEQMKRHTKRTMKIGGALVAVLSIGFGAGVGWLLWGQQSWAAEQGEYVLQREGNAKRLYHCDEAGKAFCKLRIEPKRSQ